jgi:hypothetical protein
MHKIITVKYDLKDKNKYNSSIFRFHQNLKNKFHAESVFLTSDNFKLFMLELALRKNNPFIQFNPLIIKTNVFSFVNAELKERVKNMILQFSKLDNVFVFNMFIDVKEKDQYKMHSFEISSFLQSISLKTIGIENFNSLKLDVQEGNVDSFLNFKKGVFRTEMNLTINELIPLVEDDIISKKNDFGLLSMVSSRKKEDVLIELREKMLILELISGGECA